MYLKRFSRGTFPIAMIFFAVVCAIALMALPALSGGSPQESKGDGWISLFDGRTLDGWQVAAKSEDQKKGYWKVADGMIVCDSRGRGDHDYVWLLNGQEFSDFELRLKVRSFRESKGNSGVQVRSRYDWKEHWLDGPQVDVHPPAPWRSGLIYDETRETRRWIYPSLKDWEIEQSQGPAEWKWKHADEGDGWNTLQILCQGTHIRTTVNGIRIADYDGKGVLDDEAHRRHNVGLRGHIALQLHMKDEVYIQYKEIAVRPI